MGVVTKLQEKSLYSLLEEVLSLGGKIFWSWYDRSNPSAAKNYDGTTIPGLIRFLDDREKHKLKDPVNYY